MISVKIIDKIKIKNEPFDHYKNIIVYSENSIFNLKLISSIANSRYNNTPTPKIIMYIGTMRKEVAQKHLINVADDTDWTAYTSDIHIKMPVRYNWITAPLIMQLSNSLYIDKNYILVDDFFKIPISKVALETINNPKRIIESSKKFPLGNYINIIEHMNFYIPPEDNSYFDGISWKITTTTSTSNINTLPNTSPIRYNSNVTI
jgi:hypothetical protein